MNTLFSAVLMILVFVMGGLIGYVIALSLELLEIMREMHDTELRIIETEAKIEANEREIEMLNREIEACEDSN